MRTFAYDDGGRAASGTYKIPRSGVTRDCAARAAAIATGLPYEQMCAEIRELAKREHLSKHKRAKSDPQAGVWKPTMDRLMKAHGFTWVAVSKIGKGCQMHLAEEELPSGIIVARLSRHYVAVINGVIHDTTDPSREGTRCVYGYWKKEEAT